MNTKSTIPNAATTDISAAIEQVASVFPFADYIRNGEKAGMMHLARQIMRHAGAGAGRRLLDIGSGALDKAAVFAALGYECSAVDDLSDPWHRRDGNLEKILDFAQRMSIDFHLQSFNDYTIPFPQDSFDVVTICAVIEHLHESPLGILNSAGAHLKEGGVLAVTMPNSVNLRKRISVLRGRTNYPPVEQFYLNEGPWRGHVREYTLAETVYIIKASGFEVLSATTFEEFAYEKLSGPVLHLYLWLSRLIPTVRSGLCVIARKPTGWAPAVHDAEAYRKAVEVSVPEGVR